MLCQEPIQTARQIRTKGWQVHIHWLPAGAEGMEIIQLEITWIFCLSWCGLLWRHFPIWVAWRDSRSGTPYDYFPQYSSRGVEYEGDSLTIESAVEGTLHAPSEGERWEIDSESGGNPQPVDGVNSSDKPLDQNQGENQNLPSRSERALRTQQPPAHLKDYYCRAAIVNPSCTPSHPDIPSSTVYPISNFVSYDHFSQKHRAYLAELASHEEPKSYAQAVNHAEWRDAMALEIKALEDNHTWELTTLPPGRKTVGCRWVYKIKYKATGEIEKHKARLVAKGFTQVEGEDFNETFALVAKMTTVRCLLSVAIAKGWELHQMDVNNAFLHGELDEEVYMAVPQGYSVPERGLVCRLRKSLYGLKQASRNWYSKLSQALIEYGFTECHADHSLFVHSRDSIFLAVLVYVDDLVIAGNDASACTNFKQYLSKCFHMKDLGSLKYFLGLELARGPSGLFMCQRKYTLDILNECGMLACKPCSFPMEQITVLPWPRTLLIRTPLSTAGLWGVSYTWPSLVRKSPTQCTFWVNLCKLRSKSIGMLLCVSYAI